MLVESHRVVINHTVRRAGRLLHQIVKHLLRTLFIELIARQLPGTQADLAVGGRIGHGNIGIDDGKPAILLLTENRIVRHRHPDVLHARFIHCLCTHALFPRIALNGEHSARNALCQFIHGVKSPFFVLLSLFLLSALALSPRGAWSP